MSEHLDVTSLLEDKEFRERMRQLEITRRERWGRIEAHPTRAWFNGDLASLKHAMFITYKSEREYWLEVIRRWFRAQRGPVKRKRLGKLRRALERRSLTPWSQATGSRLCRVLLAIRGRPILSLQEVEDMSLQILSDAYVRRVIHEGLGIPSKDIPWPLIEAKRVQLQLKRLIKEKRNGTV